MALPVPVKVFLKLSQVLFSPISEPNPPPPVPPFLLTQNLSPKHIARSDIMELKSNDALQCHWSGKD